MNIFETYSLPDIIREMEINFCISGEDYQLKTVDEIYSRMLARIQKQHQIDLRGKHITDDDLYFGNTRASAVLLLDNFKMMHGQFAGYLQKIMFSHHIDAKISTLNYLGFTPASMDSLWQSCFDANGMASVGPCMTSLENRFGTLNMCVEKRLLLLMFVAYRIGLDEIVSVIAKIFYYGGKA